VLALAGQDAQVTERIAVHDEQVGERAGRDDPELALAPEQLGADDRGRADDLDRRQHLRADEELARLIGLELAEQIAAERHAHTGLASQLE